MSDRSYFIEIEILNLVPKDGTSIGNNVLIGQLRDRIEGFSENEYWPVRDALVKRNLLETEKGGDGSVRFSEIDNTRQQDSKDINISSGEGNQFQETYKKSLTSRSRRGVGRSIESYTHDDKERVNNPPVGLVSHKTDQDGDAKTYSHDPHIDPELSWCGKAERISFEVPTVSLHVHERIDPRTILEAVRRQDVMKFQASLFEADEENPPLRKAIEFYKHRHNWTNRLIAGDSLLVMNSLLEKEGMGGKIQTVYIDPPYGIKYQSNFQPFVNNRDVRDGRDTDLTSEPEQIQAFRDTWELGIHSYLTYLRDRLLLARELLTDSGSCFVQIGDENVHRVGVLMDEVFGAENRVATITYVTTGSSPAKTLSEVADYLLWYACDRKQVKFRQLYEPLNRQEIVQFFNWHVGVEFPNGSRRKPTDEERFNPDKSLPQGSRIYRRMNLGSEGTPSNPNYAGSYLWQGNVYPKPPGQWRVANPAGLDRLAELNRLDAVEGGRLRWILYEDEVPGRKVHNVWSKQHSPSNKKYVVQTADSVIRKCILMTTDPGDLVFDPTCGSGTSAYVAEQWGRRWITCDTSRVAIATARQRLMTAIFDYYELAHPNEGIGSGFVYRSVKTVSAGKLAYDEPQEETAIYDRPIPDKSKSRVVGPFTVEAVPSPIVQSIDDIENLSDNEKYSTDVTVSADSSLTRMGETSRQAQWRDELFKTGIRGRHGQKLEFIRLDTLKGANWLHADGEFSNVGDKEENHRIVVSFGPEHAPLEQRQVEVALDEASKLFPKPGFIVFAAFQFDPEAAKDIDEIKWPDVQLLKAYMTSDLQTGDLKKRQMSNESFWLVGQPDVEVEKISSGVNAGMFRICVNGFDYFDILSGDLKSGGSEKIAMWMLDTDYDGRSLFARQVFFPMAGEKEGWSKLADSLKTELDMNLVECYRGTESILFKPGDNRRAAIKIIDDRGIESLRIVSLT